MNLNSNENGDANTTLFPLMCMASMEPVRIKKGSIFSNNIFDKQLLYSTFNINFSAFRREEVGPAHFALVIANLTNPLLPPQYIGARFPDVGSQEAKNFLSKPLSNFNSFKKAIILFDKRAYTIKEFDTAMEEWKTSLEEALGENNE